MASGVQRVLTGAVTGTGSAISVRTVGFRPRKVELLNTDGLATAQWTSSMADDSFVKRVTAGTMTAPTSGGVTPLSDGFTIGTDSDINASAETIHWVAYE